MTGFVSKRQAAQAKLDDDDAQGYVAEYEAALLISYQSGFADGKKAAQRPWQNLTEWEREAIVHACGAMGSDWLVFVEAVEKALKEKNR